MELSYNGMGVEDKALARHHMLSNEKPSARNQLLLLEQEMEGTE